MADWNAGALTLTPFTVIDAPEPDRSLCWIMRPPCPLLPGSGKLGTPFERMHWANASIAVRLFDPELVGLDEPPQAARPRAAVTTAIKQPTDLAEVMAEVYETRGNVTGTGPVTVA